MQTLTEAAPFDMTIDGRQSLPAAEALSRQFQHIAEKNYRDQVLLTAEKWTNRFCLMIVAASALYFAPIVVSILLR
jgi:hypothetical protein